jgi:hypothetical protein
MTRRGAFVHSILGLVLFVYLFRLSQKHFVNAGAGRHRHLSMTSLTPDAPDTMVESRIEDRTKYPKLRLC